MWLKQNPCLRGFEETAEKEKSFWDLVQIFYLLDRSALPRGWPDFLAAGICGTHFLYLGKAAAQAGQRSLLFDSPMPCTTAMGLLAGPSSEASRECSSVIVAGGPFPIQLHTAAVLAPLFHPLCFLCYVIPGEVLSLSGAVSQGEWHLVWVIKGKIAWDGSQRESILSRHQWAERDQTIQSSFSRGTSSTQTLYIAHA